MMRIDPDTGITTYFVRFHQEMGDDWSTASHPLLTVSDGAPLEVKLDYEALRNTPLEELSRFSHPLLGGALNAIIFPGVTKGVKDLLSGLPDDVPTPLLAPDAAGANPLHNLMMRKQYCPTLARLLGVDSTTAGGDTALSILAQRNSSDTEMAALLLAAGANPNHTNAEGRTPLHFAAHAMHPGLVKLLIDHGANPLHRDAIGQLPLRKLMAKRSPDFLAWKRTLARSADPFSNPVPELMMEIASILMQSAHHDSEPEWPDSLIALQQSINMARQAAIPAAAAPQRQRQRIHVSI